MPLYEYACTVCGKHTEKRQKFSDAEITDCPFCGGLLRRVITAPAFSFQGGGWYKDGYGNAAPPAAAAGGDAAPAAKAKKSGAEAAPAAGATAPAVAAAAASAPAAAPAPAAASSEKK